MSDRAQPGHRPAQEADVRIAPIAPWPEPATTSDRLAAPSMPWQEPDRPVYRIVEVPADDRTPELDEDERERLRAEAELVARITLPRRPRRRGLQPEKRWYHCLRYPWLVRWPLLRFAALLAVATIWLALMMPPLSGRPSLIEPLLYALPLAFMALSCAFLQEVLESAVAGHAPHVPLAGIGAYGQVLASAGRWLYCFLAGPSLLIGAALLYWVHCGEMDSLDRLILAELGIVAAGYWLFGLVAVTRTRRLLDANPYRVAALAHALGYRAVIVVVALSLILWPHADLLLQALAHMHHSGLGGFCQLTLVWLSLLACLTILFRLIGLWCQRMPQAAAVLL